VGTARTRRTAGARSTSGRMLREHCGRDQQEECNYQAGEPHKAPPTNDGRLYRLASDSAATLTVAQNGVNERKDSVENCHARFSKIPAAPMPPPTHIVTMP
jgi:hypothetical protein